MTPPITHSRKRSGRMHRQLRYRRRRSGDLVKLTDNVGSSLPGNDRARDDTVARQPGRHVLNVRQRMPAIVPSGISAIIAISLGGAEDRQRVEDGPRVSLTSFTPPARSSRSAMDRRRHDHNRPAGLHQEVIRIRRAAGIDDRLRARLDHEKIGGAAGSAGRRKSMTR